MGDDFVRVASQGIVSLPDASVTTAKIADGVITPIKLTGGYSDQSGNYNISLSDRVIDVTGTTAVTLPTSVGNVGRQYIIRNNGSATVTVATTGGQLIDGSATIALAGKGFLEVVADGSGWHVLRGQYADETIGRRLLTWNHAYSTGGGWQMTYGDTGWRLVALENSWAGSAYIRRENNRVTMQVFNLAGAATLTADQYTIPAGFQGGGTTFFTARETAVSGAAVWGQTRTVAEFRKTLTGETYNAGTWSMTWESNWSTADAWPSSLPGSAVGSIPQ